MKCLVLRRPRGNRLEWFQIRFGVLVACIVLSAPLFAHLGWVYWQPWSQRSAIAYFRSRHGARLDVIYSPPFELARSLYIEPDWADAWDTRAIAPIADLTTLIDCWLSELPIGDDALPYFSRLRDLTVLDLSDTNITDTGIRELVALPSLKLLYIDGTAVTDACLNDLACIPSLELVSVHRTRVTEDGIRRLHEMVAPRKLSIYHGNSKRRWAGT